MPALHVTCPQLTIPCISIESTLVPLKCTENLLARAVCVAGRKDAMDHVILLLLRSLIDYSSNLWKRIEWSYGLCMQVSDYIDGLMGEFNVLLDRTSGIHGFDKMGLFTSWKGSMWIEHVAGEGRDFDAIVPPIPEQHTRSIGPLGTVGKGASTSCTVKINTCWWNEGFNEVVCGIITALVSYWGLCECLKRR